MGNENIIIVGGGIGGMTAALALLKAGFRVDLYEQAPEFGEVGAGIMLTPNATRVLGHLGLLPALEEKASRPPASIYRRFDSAALMGDSTLGAAAEERYGAPYFHIHRADLHRILTEAVRELSAATLHTNCELADLGQDAQAVTAVFADDTRVAGDILIGCDGARSTVRGILVAAANPSFRGQVAWRGVVPAAGLPDTVTTRESVVWIGPDRHIVHYLLRGGKYVNYVAISAKEQWEEEGWNRAAEVDEVVGEFQGWHQDVVQLLAATPPNTCFKWGLFDREPLSTWTAGRCTLLGDAAHPMLPFMAQGSAMAIEDALVLARSLQSFASVEEALKRYERARQGRTSQVILQSRAATGLYQKLSGDKTQQRAQNLDTVYGYDAVTCNI